MRTPIIILFSFLTVKFFSQTKTETIKVKKETELIYGTLIDRPAFFKDSTNLGRLFIKDYIDSNIKIPDSVRTGIVSGIVYVGFTIKENGELTNIHIIKGLKNCFMCDKEALRLISVMPKWTPALILGKTVSSNYNLPIKFEQKK
jgi:protein TonB